eukprot:COSAG01_NODE_1833_length_9107_cov_7.147313_6_plen_114_part_00
MAARCLMSLGLWTAASCVFRPPPRPRAPFVPQPTFPVGCAVRTRGCAPPSPLTIGWLCTAQGVGQGTLIVKLIECNGLISGDANGLSDPYDPRLSRGPDRLTPDGSLACCTRH